MSEEDLKEYLACKGDRVAVQTFSRDEKSSAECEGKKSELITKLRNRMGIAKSKDSKDSSSSDDDFRSQSNVSKKGKKSSSFFFQLRNGKKIPGNQSSIASKNDRALMVGFTIYDFHSKKYRQVRAPMGGGIRHPRVDKNTKKQELLEIVRPLFFPRGKNCHGKVEEFNFDISTDVRGTQLMLDDESVEDIMTRLGLKHFRCYLLALKRTDDDIGSLPDLQHEDDDDLMVVSVDIEKIKVQQATDIRSNTSDDGASPKNDPMKFDVCNQPVFVDYIAESPLLPWPLLGSSSQEEVLLVTNLQTPADNNVLDSGVAHSNLPLDNSVTDDTLPASLLPSQVPGGSCQEDLVSTTLFTEGLQTPCTSEQHMSSVAVENSKPQSDETLIEKNFPEVCQIIVHIEGLFVAISLTSFHVTT